MIQFESETYHKF